MPLSLLKRAGLGRELTAADYDANIAAIEAALNGVEARLGALGATPTGDIEPARRANFTLGAASAGKAIPCLAALTITVPSAATLGDGFFCEVLAAGGNIVLDGPGATNVTLTTGEIATVVALSGRVYVARATATQLDAGTAARAASAKAWARATVTGGLRGLGLQVANGLLSARATGAARFSLGRAAAAKGLARASAVGWRPGAVLHTVTLGNPASAPSTVAHRCGLAFPPGDMPAGSRVVAKRPSGIAARGYLIGQNFWPDGSVRTATLVLHDDVALIAGGSRAYDISAEPGAQATSSFNPWAWVASHAQNFTVDVTARSGSTSGALPSLTFGLKAISANTSRRVIEAATPAFVRAKCWGTAGTEQHLTATFYLDFWLGADGLTPIAVEWSVVLSQHWWVTAPFGTAQPKERQSYTATVKYGGTALDTRAGLSHAYYCRWASLRPADDHWHATKHWLDLGSTPMPTLIRAYSDASRRKMMKAGLVPPMKLDAAYTGDLYPPATTYAPLGANGHRAAMSATGGYIGRGMMTDQDGKALVMQTADRWRKARVAAQAGLSAPFHIRDHRIPSGGTSPAIEAPITPAMQRLTQSYNGLAAPTVAVKGTGGTLAHAAPTGGTGAFSGYAGAFNVPYSAFMAWADGESYLADAALSGLDICLRDQAYSDTAHNPPRLYADSAFAARRTALAIPDTDRWGHSLALTGQERTFAWAVNELVWAWGILPAGHPWAPVLRDLIRNLDDMLSASFDYYPQGHRDRGGAWVRALNHGLTAPWQLAWQGMAMGRLLRQAPAQPRNTRGLGGLEESWRLSGQHVLGLMQSRPYAGQAFRALWGTGSDVLAPLPAGEHGVFLAASNVGAVVTIAHEWQGFGVADGDYIYPIPADEQAVAYPVPPQLTPGTRYYAVQASGSTCRLATTPGGPPLALTDTANWHLHLQNQETATVATVGPQGTRYWPSDDDYLMILAAAAEQAIGEGHPAATTAGATKLRAFMAPKMASVSAFSSWAYDGTNLT